jgi:hypothetical protein
MDDIHYIKTPESETRGISIVPDLFEFFEMRFNALVVGAVAGIAEAIGILWVANIGYWQSHNKN